MTTTIEDNELGAELQELYLKTKHWISDVEFIESELGFLKLLFVRKFPHLFKTADFEDIAESLKKIDRVECALPKLKHQIQVYLDKLESLIIEVKQNMDLSLIEIHTNLEIELTNTLQTFQNLKSNIFYFTKHMPESDVLVSEAV